MIVKGIQDTSYLGKELREIECWKKTFNSKWGNKENTQTLSWRGHRVARTAPSSLENGLALSFKTKSGLITWPGNCICRHLSKRN